MNEEALDRRFLLTALGGVAGVAALSSVARAGPITPPPGPVGSTGHTTDELWGKIARTDAGFAEPRVPVQSLPGSATAVYVISQPGSYYLTGNIQGVTGKSGIEIASNDVSIDLRGYSVIGAPGTIHAISVQGDRFRIIIHSGVLRDWGDHGVYGPFAAKSSRIFEVLVGNCGNTGIQLSAASVIERCTAVQCAQRGFGTEDRGQMLDCVAMDCGIGFYNVGSSRVERCSAYFCGTGYRPQARSTVGDCFSVGCSVGFSLGEQSTATRCRSEGGGTGFVAASGCTLDENIATSANTGFVAASRVLLTRNRSSGNTSAFSLASDAAYGPIVNVAGVGSIGSTPNANHPWANFIF